MSTEEALRTQMREAVATERPTRVLDIRRAMAAGRRQRLRRRAAGVAVTAVLAGAAFLVPAVVRPDGGLPPAVTASPSPSPTPQTDGTLEVALPRIDPAIQYLRFGWLPEGFTFTFYEAGPDSRRGDSAELTAGGTDTSVNVHLYPSGVTPVELDSGSATPELVGPEMSIAPAVNGRPAQWAGYVEGVSSWEYLQWEYAPGGVIRVRANGFGSGGRDVAHRVASSLRLSDDEPVVLPFTLPGHELRYVGLVEVPLVGSGNERVVVQYQPDITVVLFEGNPRDAETFPPNTIVDGRQAFESTERFDLRDLDGRSLRVVVPSGGARAVYENLDVVSNIGEWEPDL
jgi:hypothetical protein